MSPKISYNLTNVAKFVCFFLTMISMKRLPNKNKMTRANLNLLTQSMKRKRYKQILKSYKLVHLR